jgi:23S rRNA pseudouridine1911/1915/1917 synthase
MQNVEQADVCVLFEDDHLLAVSKPAGLVSHPCYKHPDGTLFDALLLHLRDTGAHPRLLQRLDKGTSGVMLVSKTMKAHAGVVRAMGRGAAGGVKKEYLAVVHGAPDPPAGEIACRLRRDPADTRRVAVSETEGKESVTRYRVVAVSHREVRDAGDERESRGTAAGRRPQADGRRASVVLCEPLTGRMHQLRVHLAACGWPIVGDPVYGPGDIEGVTIGRQALHAWRVSLTHPVTGAPLVVTAPVPPDFATLLEHLGLNGVQT